MSPRRHYPELILLVVLATLTRGYHLFIPNSVVFDEVYFKAFAGHYLDGKYFFDIHPPFAKLLLAGWAHLWGLTGGQLISGTALPLRILPAAFGVLIIPLIWGITLKLTSSRRAAFLAAFLVLADNALTVESRFILMDPILLATGLGAVLTYLVARQRATYRRSLLALSALLSGACVSTKWTGLTALALIGLAWLFDSRKFRLRSKLIEGAILIIIPLALYVGLFFVHFQLLPRSGDGDAFMSSRFQAGLVGSPYYGTAPRLSFLQKFTELNVEMFRANQTLTATHPYGSLWYSWPLELRPIYYWQGEVLPDGRQGNIYLLGNPLVWWGSLLAILSGIILILFNRRLLSPQRLKTIMFLLLAYLCNYLPFATVSRVMFLYHYLFSFLYGLILAVVLWTWLLEAPAQRNRLWANIGYIMLILVVTSGFVYFAPLTYGWALSPTELQAHMWLSSWR